MPRYRFLVEYSGTPFVGWQRQSPSQAGMPSVQGVLEQALETALRIPIKIVGAGRTDAGVHALGQVAHFDADESLRVDPGKLERSLNALAGPDICIRRLEPCSEDFHARFSALTRSYRYLIALRPVAMQRQVSWFSGARLDIDLFRQELLSALGDKDFVAFSIRRKDDKSTRCHVLRVSVDSDEVFLHIQIEANRFVHKMVRSLVGACYEVARGKFAPGLISKILSGEFQGERWWAPAHGLCLEKVKYPDSFS